MRAGLRGPTLVGLIVALAVLSISTLEQPWQEAFAAGLAAGFGLWVYGGGKPNGR
jgi:hypothetical protein